METETETLESGPVAHNLWDTRNKENSFWCEKCQKWIKRSAWISEREHRNDYCKGTK